MSSAQHLSRLFLRFSEDSRITAWHMALYLALIFLWQSAGMKKSIHISRRQLMQLSRIQSNVTYHKCIKQLQEYGYIRYTPSYHPLHGSSVELLLA
jgi:hypothetical protein